MRADSATTRGKKNATSKNWTIDRSRKRRRSGRSSVDFSHSSSTVHQVCNTASFSLAPSPSLISALLLPVCTVYISFDQHIRHISMYLDVPLRSTEAARLSAAAVRAKASPRYGRRRSGLVRVFITNEPGLALPTTGGRTKSLAMHVLSGPLVLHTTACTLAHE